MSRTVQSGLHRPGLTSSSKRRAKSANITPKHKNGGSEAVGWTCRSCGEHNTTGALQCHSCEGLLPSVILFKAHTIIEGKHRFTRISWETSGAESVRISPGRGDLPEAGQLELEVEPDTVFTLIAGNNIGTRKITTGISLAPPRILRFEAADTEIQIGYPVILSWEIENAAKVFLSRGIGDMTGRTFVEAYLDSPEPVLLTVENEQGQASAEVALTLPLPEIQSFYAGATHIPAEGTVPLYWQVSNAKEVSLEPYEGEEALEPLGTLEVRPERDTRYVLKARNAAGTISADLEIAVPPPKIRVFGSPNGISLEGEEVLLTWEVDFAEEVMLEPQVGEVPPCGSTWVIPTEAFTFFTLTAKGASGTISETYQVTRFPIPLESQLLLLPEENNQAMARQTTEKKTPLHDLAQMEHDINALSQAQLRDLQIKRAKEKKLTYELLDLKKASVRQEIKQVIARLKNVFKS